MRFSSASWRAPLVLTIVNKLAVLSPQGVKGLRIAIVEESLSGPLHDERYAGMVVEAAIKLEKLGANVERISIPDVLLAPDLWMVSRRVVAC
jgi:Asp-tRNA(Asn)/Glu-tRNA(Gln) amidotransferase A subunit family amidase